MDLNGLLTELRDEAAEDLRTPAEIVEGDEIPGIDAMALEARRWVKVREVIAVKVDLTNSTRLNFTNYDKTSARVYEGFTRTVALLAREFEAGFADVQGDAVIALFSGNKRLERAFCMAETAKTFGRRHFAELTKVHITDKVDLLAKVGMAHGPVLVKRIGVRGDFNAPV